MIFLEIKDYAKYLGLDLRDDNDLLWIAKEGLKAPLPEPWKPCKNPKGEIYYFNFETNELIWEHPCDQYYKKLCQEEKLKKAQRQIQSQLEAQRLSRTKSHSGTNYSKLVQLPGKVGNKVAIESEKLDKEYNTKLENYKKKKKNELTEYKKTETKKTNEEDSKKVLDEYRKELNKLLKYREVSL